MIGIRTTRSTSDSESSRRSSSTAGPASVVDAAALVPRRREGRRTLDDVRDQVAQEIAIHTITKAKSVDGGSISNVAFDMLILTLQVSDLP